MQFKHPEILYALFLLLIPIIVHLFQLRRFEKVPFTNVKFLKQVELQTRKSSKLKKFLILCTRLLALAGLILAFAQPYLSNLKKEDVQSTYIYLDNSYSMQAKGSKGELLKRASQDIIENLSDVKNINLITNDKFLKNLSLEDLKRELLELNYHPINQDINSTLFKIKNELKNNKNTLNDIILVSDFQNYIELDIDTINSFNLVQLLPVKQENISIDSVYISNQNNENITLQVIINNHNSKAESANISLYNNAILQGKSNVTFTKKDTEVTEFIIANNGDFNGRLVLDDSNLLFDNELFFSINKSDKINTLAIGQDTDYLSRIYTDNEFNYTSTTLDQLDYSTILDQNLIIVNELEDIPISLTNNLLSFIDNGGSLVIIPYSNSNINSYNTLLSTLNVGSVNNRIENELTITDINFAHPILKNVFEKQIKNFQYPSVKSYFNIQLRNNSSILKFENEAAFISESKVSNGTIYFLAAAISKENSNFKNSPLIVPIFYNFGKNSYKHSELNYTIGRANQLDVKVNLNKDNILQIAGDSKSFIPLQQIGNSSVKITLDNQPLKSGFYQLKNKDQVIKNIAFNYDRSESYLNYSDLESFSKDKPNVSYSNSVEKTLNTIKKEYQTSNLWQTFLLLAILFLLVEVGLLKFLKS